MKDRIGEIAGEVWRLLDKKGPMPVKTICRSVNGATESQVLMALGWLARENQIDLQGAEPAVRVTLHRAMQTA